jgi:iron complex outermembrane recepter protein
MTSNAFRWAASASICFVLIALMGVQSARAQAREFNVPAQSATTGIPEFARQAAIQILVSETLVRGKRTAAVTGALPVQKALVILLEGTGLIANSKDGTTFTLSVAATRTTSRNLSGTSSGDSAALEDKGPPEKEPKSSSSEDERTELAEIIVTGTNIRGVTSSASPVQVFTRQDIDRTGLGTLQSFFEKLPQNFSGVSENTISTVAGSTTSGNAASASAINLRGLGSDSTLLLVDGHRVAAGGLNGDIADVSLIPLAAVDRVEIVTDGASAIYGSDAVGGVVNVILRKDFDGAETRARFGSVSEGASHETQIGQTFGKTWAGGSAVLSYEYLDRTPLSAANRAFSRTAVEPFSLLPEQLRNAVFATLQQQLSNDVSIFADGTFSRRETNQSSSVLGFSEQTPAEIEAYSGVLGGRARLSDKAEVEISTAYAGSKQHIEDFQNSFSNGTSPENRFDIDTACCPLTQRSTARLAFFAPATCHTPLGLNYVTNRLIRGSMYSLRQAALISSRTEVSAPDLWNSEFLSSQARRLRFRHWN